MNNLFLITNNNKKMDPQYFKLSLREKDIYFMIDDIKKNLVYSTRGQDFFDYQIVIKDIHLPTNSKIDSEYSGQFVCIDEKRNLRIFNYITKEFSNIEENFNLNHLSYIYQNQDYWTSLENVMKEILLWIFKNK
jgi:hypothetical protein